MERPFSVCFTLASITLFCTTSLVQADQFDCVIEPSATISVVAADTGLVREVLVRQGDYVRKGDILIHLNDDVQRMQVELNQIQASSDVDIRAAQERLTLRQKEFIRANELAQRNIAAQIRVEETAIEVSLAEMALEQTQIAQSLARVQLEQSQKLLERRTVRSLVEGVVRNVQADPGEYASEQYELMTIAQVDPLWIRTFLPVELYEALEIGAHYKVSQDQTISGDLVARLVSVDRVFDVASGTFGVLFEYANEDGKLPAGLRCSIEVPIDPAN